MIWRPGLLKLAFKKLIRSLRGWLALTAARARRCAANAARRYGAAARCGRGALGRFMPNFTYI
eukprot:6212758-Pleurochrysis_carterae.AAC.3